VYEVIDPCHSKIPVISHSEDDFYWLTVSEGVSYYWFYEGEFIPNSDTSHIPVIWKWDVYVPSRK
jgi:hypothetical protein